MTASTRTGWRSSRARRIASRITWWVSTTSMPSQRMPGTPKPSPRRCRSVTAEWRSSAVPIPNWLLVTMKTTGSRHSAARFSVSPNVPWLAAPSPNTQSVTSSVPR